MSKYLILQPAFLFAFIWFSLINHPAYSQMEITWKTLSDVQFTDRYSAEVDANYFYPHFGSSVRALEGKDVYIKGYMLAIEPKKRIFILSKNPFASCFFCGNGGPESIVELNLKLGNPKFKMDQIVTIKGVLRLNKNDMYQCNYILDNADVYKPSR